MRATTILRQRFSSLLQEVHAFRRESFFSAVGAVVDSGSLVLTNFGRALGKRTTTDKHGIKRADRLLGNPRLAGELEDWYRALAHRVVGKTTNPIVLVDWTDATGGKNHRYDGLVAAVVVGCRSIPILETIVPKTQNNSPAVHKRFLVSLREILPPGCRPVIVTDAGFRTPWFELVESFEWSFVGRVRGGMLVEDDGRWCSSQDLYKRAGRAATDLGLRRLTRSRQKSHRLILSKQRCRDRKRKASFEALSIRKKRSAAGAREPWLLATSERSLSPAAIVAIYRHRMAIEEAFRDQKSHRFGWGLKDAGTRALKRIAILRLLAAFALYVTTIVGFSAEKENLHRSYQANTHKRRVLSWPTLGRKLLTRISSKQPKVPLLPLPGIARMEAS